MLVCNIISEFSLGRYVIFKWKLNRTCSLFTHKLIKILLVQNKKVEMYKTLLNIEVLIFMKVEIYKTLLNIELLIFMKKNIYLFHTIFSQMYDSFIIKLFNFLFQNITLIMNVIHLFWVKLLLVQHHLWMRGVQKMLFCMVSFISIPISTFVSWNICEFYV